MQFEVEKKFWVSEFEPLEASLAKLGTEFGDAVEQIDHYFSHPARDFEQTDEALRLRQVGDRNFLTYKGARIGQTAKTREELDLALRDGHDVADDFRTLLAVLDFQPIMTVRKSRRKAVCQWEGQPVEICLDEIDQLGTFAELEITSDAQHLESAQQHLVSLAGHLGLDRHEQRSYLELLLHQLAPPNGLASL